MKKLQWIIYGKVLLSCLVLLSFQSFAQESVKIKEVRVVADAPSSQELSRQEIDSMALMDPTNKDLGAGLSKYTHAFVKTYGIGSLATVSLRGSGSSHTNLIWNGTNLNSASVGVVDFSLIPPIFTDEVGVDYGLNSMANGSGGLGGAVNMKSKVDFSAKEEALFQQQLGSFGHRSTAFRIKTGNNKIRSVSRLVYKAANNNFTYHDISEVGSPRTTVNNAELEQKGILQSFHYRPKAEQRIDAHLWYFDSERELPNMMSLRDLQESQYDENFRLQLAFHQYFNRSKLSLNSTYLKDRIIYRNNQLSGNSSSLNESVRSFIQLENNWGKLKLLNRFDMDKEFSKQSNYPEDQIQRDRFALFTELSYNIGKSIRTSLSARQEWVESDAFFLPQARIDYQSAGNNYRSWLMAGRNMKYPSLNDLFWEAGGNPELEAEVSENAEFGQQYSADLSEKWKYNAKLTAYYQLIDNYIQWTPTNLGFWQASNLQQVESKGIELDLGMEHLLKRFHQSYHFIYNYVNSINLVKNFPEDRSVGKQLIYVPEHQYDLNGRWQYDLYSLELNLQFVGARYLLSDNTDWLPYYQVLDLTFGKKWKLGSDEFSLQISARNLLNADYQAIQWRPMPGRNYMLSINYLLK